MKKSFVISALFCSSVLMSIPTHSMEYIPSFLRTDSNLEKLLKEAVNPEDADIEIGLKKEAGLSGKHIGNVGVLKLCLYDQELCQYKYNFSHLSTLNLNANSIGDDAGHVLAEHLIKHPNIISLNLSRNFLGQKSAGALSKNPFLLQLDVSYNVIDKQGAMDLSKSPSLTDLNLSYNKIRCAKDVFIALMANTHLTKLGFSNPYTLSYGEEAKKVGVAVGGAGSIITLYAGVGAMLGSFGVVAGTAADFLDPQPILNHTTSAHEFVVAPFDVGMGAIFGGGTVSLFPLLSCPSWIPQILNCANKKLGKFGMGTDEAEVLSSNTTLREIDLSGNFITDGIAKILSKTTTLTKLNLSNNYINEDGMDALLTIPNLTDLNLSNNKVDIIWIRETH